MFKKQTTSYKEYNGIKYNSKVNISINNEPDKDVR